MFKKYRFAGMLLGVFALSAGAHAAPMTFKATLSGDQEVAAVDTTGTGQVTVVFDPVAMTMAIDLWFSGLLGTTTAAHIHCCTTVPGEQNVGVATTTPTFAGFPAGVQAGTFQTLLDLTKDSSWSSAFVTNNGGTLVSATAVLGAGLGSGNAYFNIHTKLFPPGEIRGNLVRAVPEPGTLGLLAFLGLVAMAPRRRRVETATAPA